MYGATGMSIVREVHFMARFFERIVNVCTVVCHPLVQLNRGFTNILYTAFLTCLQVYQILATACHTSSPYLVLFFSHRWCEVLNRAFSTGNHRTTFAAFTITGYNFPVCTFIFVMNWCVTPFFSGRRVIRHEVICLCFHHVLVFWCENSRCQVSQRRRSGILVEGV